MVHVKLNTVSGVIDAISPHDPSLRWRPKGSRVAPRFCSVLIRIKHYKSCCMKMLWKWASRLTVSLNVELREKQTNQRVWNSPFSQMKQFLKCKQESDWFCFGLKINFDCENGKKKISLPPIWCVIWSHPWTEQYVLHSVHFAPALFLVWICCPWAKCERICLWLLIDSLPSGFHPRFPWISLGHFN